jgi:hypothetical protein
VVASSGVRTYHKVAGAILALQILAWIVTGLLFNYKFRYDEAYEPLSAPPSASTAPNTWVSPADAMARAGLPLETLRNVRLFHDARGYLYLLETGTEDTPVVHLADARTGDAVAPLDEAGAAVVLKSALATSKFASSYGAVARSRPVDAESPLLGHAAPGWEFTLASGQRLTVNAVTAEVTHAALLNDVIDWTYRVHYMQYTPWKTVNIVIVLIFLALLLSLVLSGLRMLIGTRTRPMFGGRSRRSGPRIRF